MRRHQLKLPSNPGTHWIQPGYDTWHVDDVMRYDLSAISAFIRNWKRRGRWTARDGSDYEAKLANIR